MARSKSYRKKKNNPHNLKCISSLVTHSLFFPSLFLVDQNHNMTEFLFHFSLSASIPSEWEAGSVFSIGVSHIHECVCHSSPPFLTMYPTLLIVFHLERSSTAAESYEIIIYKHRDSLILLAPSFAYPNCHHVCLETTCCFPGHQII